MGFLDTITPVKKGIIKRVEGTDIILAEEEASPDLGKAAHWFLAFLFLGTVIAYAFVALYWHFTRPEVESFMQLPASQLDPITVRVTAVCSNPPFCGNVTIAANYTSNVTSGCAGVFPRVIHEEFDASVTGSPVSVILQLCAIEDVIVNPQIRTALPVPGIQVNFAAINPGVDTTTTPHTPAPLRKASGSVTIESMDGVFSRTVSMDTWQVKTLVVGQSVMKLEDAVRSQTAFPVAIQYEGGRPNWRSTLLVKLDSFANVYESSRPGNLLTVIASIGGAVYLVAAVLALIGPMFGACCPGPTAEKPKPQKQVPTASKYSPGNTPQPTPIDH